MAYYDENNTEDKPVNILSRLFLIFFIMVFLTSSVMFVSWLNQPGNFPFKKVELVNRLENQESKELQKIAAKALNGGFFSLDVAEFRAELLNQLPWVKAVSVRKVWPNKLLVEITENKPVVRWLSAELKTEHYQLLSEDGIVFEPELTDAQKLKFNSMALFSGPKVNAKKILNKCFEISNNLKKVDLGIKHCGMNKRRTWTLTLSTMDVKKEHDKNLDIKLGKEKIIQQLDRFIDVFSGKLKQYLSSIEYVDLRYSNGFSVKWNVTKTLDEPLQAL